MQLLLDIMKMWNWWNRQGNPCLFHFFTGWYCPGCGGTRAFYNILSGQILPGFFQNSFVLYVILIIGLELLSGLLEFAGIQKNPKTGNQRWSFILAIGLGLLTINCLMKNLGLFFGIDLLSY